MCMIITLNHRNCWDLEVYLCLWRVYWVIVENDFLTHFVKWMVKHLWCALFDCLWKYTHQRYPAPKTLYWLEKETFSLIRSSSSSFLGSCSNCSIGFDRSFSTVALEFMNETLLTDNNRYSSSQSFYSSNIIIIIIIFFL